MIKEALEYLHGLARPELVEVDGRQHSTRQLHELPDPKYPTIAVHSLRGVVDYYKAADFLAVPETKSDALLGLHIVGPREVRLVGAEFGPFRRRSTYCEAKPADGDAYPFGRYLDPETFVVSLSAMFVDGDDRPDILAVMGNLRDEAVLQIEDDGVTQTVQTKRGIDRQGTVKVHNPVTLRPYRTFADIPQPQGQFIIRTRGGGEGKPPSIALFEVDDGAWRRESIEGIRAYFAEHLEGVAVIG